MCMVCINVHMMGVLFRICLYVQGMCKCAHGRRICSIHVSMCLVCISVCMMGVCSGHVSVCIVRVSVRMMAVHVQGMSLCA